MGVSLTPTLQVSESPLAFCCCVCTINLVHFLLIFLFCLFLFFHKTKQSKADTASVIRDYLSDTLQMTLLTVNMMCEQKLLHQDKGLYVHIIRSSVSFCTDKCRQCITYYTLDYFLISFLNSNECFQLLTILKCLNRQC